MITLMTTYILPVAVVVLLVALAALRVVIEKEDHAERTRYRYTRKQYFLTRAEHEFYDVLLAAVGDTYHIFAQVHLSTVLSSHRNGKNNRAALAHINRKSVDFVLCDKNYISPKLAIELDDKSHERPDRQLRDKEVERILADAGLPLLRIENKGRFTASELAKQVQTTLTQAGEGVV